jgi:hypothetical protein
MQQGQERTGMTALELEREVGRQCPDGREDQFGVLVFGLAARQIIVQRHGWKAF